jgi:peptidoglycan/LPS O-acetylase OafA/YrhL
MTAGTTSPPGPSDGRPPDERRDYRPALDGVRAIAICAVIAYHFGYGRGGFLGVDLFFVLSGYLITGLLVSEYSRTGRISIPRFWVRRVRRLYPALLVVVLAVLGYAQFVADPLERWSLKYDAFSSLFYFANWRFAYSAQSYFAQFASPSPLRHFWSLAIEEQFYLVWPGLAAALIWLGRRRTLLLGMAATAGAAGSAIVLALQWSSVDPSGAYYSTFARAHELLIGAVLALLLRSDAARGWFQWPLNLLAGVALTAIAIAFVVVSDTSATYYRGGSVVFCLVAAALIASVEAVGVNPVRDLLAVWPMRYVGRISYALYLWHWPIVVWVTADRVSRFGIRLDGSALNGLRLVVMAGLAVVSTHYVEEPIRRGSAARWLTPRRVAYVLPVVSLTMILITVGLTRGAMASAEAEFVTVTTPHGVTLGRVSPKTPVVVVLGDSVPRALEPELAADARADGLVLVNAAVTGCGVVDQLQADHAGHLVAWQGVCDSTAYPDEQKVVRRYHPNVVIVYSSTENESFLIGGHAYRPGTPEHQKALRAGLIAAHERLTAAGAKLVVVRVPPHALPSTGCADPQAEQRCADDAIFNSTVSYVNAQLEWLARLYSDTRVISLNGLICPSGPPCPTQIDGVVARPDGTHFSAAFAPRVARALLAAAAS